MSVVKTERVEELRTLLTEQEPSTHTASALAARFGVAIGTLGTDLSYLLREGMVDRDDLVRCGLLQTSSIEALETLPVRTRTGSAGRGQWMQSAATVLLNLHARADGYEEADAYFEARLVMVAREMASRASVVPGQRIMPFAVKVPDRGSVTQAEDGTFKICEHLGCLRVERPGDDLPPCPRGHGAAKEVSSADAVVGHLAELHFVDYLKRAKREQSLQRVEHLDQRHALRGCDPTMRKRPDFTVWNKTGDEYWVDVKARRVVRDEFFIIKQAEARVMTYWQKPVVVIFERTGEIEIDASRFYVVDQRLLSKLAMARKPPALVKAMLPQNSIVF
jgi:hypothetical protein